MKEVSSLIGITMNDYSNVQKWYRVDINWGFHHVYFFTKCMIACSNNYVMTLLCSKYVGGFIRKYNHIPKKTVKCSYSPMLELLISHLSEISSIIVHNCNSMTNKQLFHFLKAVSPLLMMRGIIHRHRITLCVRLKGRHILRWIAVWRGTQLFIDMK